MTRAFVVTIVALVAIGATGMSAHADTGVTVGPAKTLLRGGKVDSVWTTFWKPTTTTTTKKVRVRIRNRQVVRRRMRRRVPHPRYRVRKVTRTSTRNLLYGMTSNRSVWTFRQAANGKLSHETVILNHGGPRSPDDCGIHPAGAIYKATKTHWIDFYHAERAAPGEGCDTNRAEKHTRWTVREMQTYNGGKTWVKNGAVLTQDTHLLIHPETGKWNFRHDDAGEVHLTVRGQWMYLTYDASPNANTGRRESLARAPVSSLGKPGSWRKWYHGSFSQPGLGGDQSPLDDLPTGTRGISYNTYLKEFLAVSVRIGGAFLYTSHDLIHWTHYAPVFTTGLTQGAWGHGCKPPVAAVYGYGSIIGETGSPGSSGKTFYLYYMFKPEGVCFDQRQLRREEVTLTSTRGTRVQVAPA